MGGIEQGSPFDWETGPDEMELDPYAGRQWEINDVPKPREWDIGLD